MADDSSPTLKAAAAGAWISAIILIVILAGLLFGWFSSGVKIGTGGIFAWIGNFFKGIFSWMGGRISSGGVSLLSILTAVILFIPDTALLGGFIADAVNAQFRYSVPSIAALVAAILNFLVSLKTDNGARLTEYIMGSPLSDAVASSTAALPQTSASSGGIFGSIARTITGAAPPASSATAAATTPPRSQPRPPTAIGYGVDPTSGAAAAVADAAASATSAAAPLVTTPPSSATADSLNSARVSSTARSVVTRASRPGAAGNQSTISTNLLGGRSKQTGGGKLTGSHMSILGIPLGSKSQPAGLAVLATIVMIYTLDAASGKRHGAALAVQVTIGILSLIAYWVSYNYTEGFADMKLSLIPIIIGIAVGAGSYYIFSKNHPLDPEATPPNASGEYSKCSAGGGNGEFVCDAYLNGVRIGTVPT